MAKNTNDLESPFEKVEPLKTLNHQWEPVWSQDLLDYVNDKVLRVCLGIRNSNIAPLRVIYINKKPFTRSKILFEDLNY